MPSSRRRKKHYGSNRLGWPRYYPARERHYRRDEEGHALAWSISWTVCDFFCRLSCQRSDVRSRRRMGDRHSQWRPATGDSRSKSKVTGANPLPFFCLSLSLRVAYHFLNFPLRSVVPPQAVRVKKVDYLAEEEFEQEKPQSQDALTGTVAGERSFGGETQEIRESNDSGRRKNLG